VTSDNNRSGDKRSAVSSPPRFLRRAGNAALLEAAEASRKDLPPPRVTARDNLHLTLVFLGNLTVEQLDNTVIPRVTDIVDQATPGRVLFRQVVGFPSKEQPRHLVLKVPGRGERRDTAG